MIQNVDFAASVHIRPKDRRMLLESPACCRRHFNLHFTLLELWKCLLLTCYLIHGGNLALYWQLKVSSRTSCLFPKIRKKKKNQLPHTTKNKTFNSKHQFFWSVTVNGLKMSTMAENEKEKNFQQRNCEITISDVKLFCLAATHPSKGRCAHVDELPKLDAFSQFNQ